MTLCSLAWHRVLRCRVPHEFESDPDFLDRRLERTADFERVRIFFAPDFGSRFSARSNRTNKSDVGFFYSNRSAIDIADDTPSDRPREKSGSPISRSESTNK